MELTFLAVQVLALSVDLSGEVQDVENTLDQVCEHPKKFVREKQMKKACKFMTSHNNDISYNCTKKQGNFVLICVVLALYACYYCILFFSVFISLNHQTFKRKYYMYIMSFSNNVILNSTCNMLIMYIVWHP